MTERWELNCKLTGQGAVNRPARFFSNSRDGLNEALIDYERAGYVATDIEISRALTIPVYTTPVGEEEEAANDNA